MFVKSFQQIQIVLGWLATQVLCSWLSPLIAWSEFNHFMYNLGLIVNDIEVKVVCLLLNFKKKVFMAKKSHKYNEMQFLFQQGLAQVAQLL